ncbi:MAG: Flp family type IVb pilin [Candidatus Eisenbacteria bacterium]|nr:Flp family type IVb pilin [Candidatus Eisenbacteria bacterium]
MRFLNNVLTSRKGAATTEYALLVALIAVAMIGAIILLRDELIRTLTAVASALTGV